MIGVSLLGADGSTWDLRRGPIRLAPGPEGLGLPKFSRPTVESPGLDGQALQAIGSRALAREGQLKGLMQPQATEAAWLALQRAWWAAWSPDLPATITITDPNGGTRSIGAFLDSDDGYGLDLEPTVNLFEELPVSWVADDPWWRGPEVQAGSATVATGGDWLAGGTAPPFAFQAAAVAGSGLLTNPGEVPAWPVYRVSAGTTSWSVAVNGQATAGAFTIPAGSRLVVDTDPAVQTALLIDGSGNVTNVTPQLSAIAFAQVPVGGSVPVTTSVQGGNGASVTVAISPRYRRGF